MAIMALLQEPFTGLAVPSGWTQSLLGSAAITYDTTGVTISPPAATTAATDGDLNFTATNDLTGSFARIAVLGVSGAGATSTDNVFRIRQNSTNYVTIFYEAGSIFFSKVVAGAQTNIASATYDPVAHAWWQIREKGGVTFWETSPDGQTWTTRTSQANPIALTAVDVLIGLICFGVDLGAGPFKFRGFNYPLAGTTTSTSSISTSSTSSSISSTSTSISSTSTSLSTSSTSTSLSSTSSSVSSTSSSISSTSISSTSSSTSISSTSSSISSTSFSSTSLSSTSSSTSISSTSSSISSTSSSVSSTSHSTSSTSVSSTSSSSSTSTTAIELKRNYRYEDDNILDSDNANLDNPFTAPQVSYVSGDDGDYFIEYGSEYMMRQYKYKHINNTDGCRFTWRGRSTYDTRQSPILIQIYNNNGTTIVDSYSESNFAFSTGIAFSPGQNDSVGQSFSGNGRTLGTAVFYNSKAIGKPSGYAVAKIYNHSGVFGTSGIPTGPAIATSDTVVVDSLTASPILTTFNFSGNNQILLANGTNYFVAVEFEFGDVNNSLGVGIDNTSPSHAGNIAFRSSSAQTWSASASFDACFYVYTEPWETLARETRVPADVDFTAQVVQSTNMSNYYDSNNIITFRSYQQVI